MTVLPKKKVIFYVVVILAILGIAIFFYKYRIKIGRIVTPFLLAILIAYIVKPMANKLETKKIPRMMAILSVYLFFILVIAAACIFLVPELINNTKELMTTLPDIMSRYQEMFNDMLSAIQSSKWSDDVKNMIFREVQSSIGLVQNYAAEALKKALSTLIDTVAMILNLALSLVIAYYMIKDADHFKTWVLSLIPRRWRNGIAGTGKEISLILSSFIQGQLLTAFIVGIMESIGLAIIKVKYPLVMGMIGGLANVIPYFGPYIGAVPAVALALIQSPLKALWAVLVFAIVQQIDNSFISPKMIEGKLGLHPLATILAVLVGGEFFGILGMLLAVPVMAILRVIMKRVVDAIV